MKLHVFFILLVIWAGIVQAQINNNINQNHNNVIINNQPVIKEKEYIIQYRTETVYRDRPQPKRYARKLSAPVCLIGSIWVYVEDLGDYGSLYDANEIVARLNDRGAYGRNDWRIPTSAELSIMEQNADKVGLGDGIYIATSHRNGILRPVSTGMSIAQQRQIQEAERRRIEAERKRRELERLREEDAYRAKLNEQQDIISSGRGVKDGDIIWATSNVGASSYYEKGSILSSYSAYNGWRLPSKEEIKNLISKATLSRRPANGYLQTLYTYNGIVLIRGRYLTNDGYYDVGDADGINGARGYVRLVRDVIH